MVRFWIVGLDPLRLRASSSTTATSPSLLPRLPERALVLGLARSGEAAALALARRGVRRRRRRPTIRTSTRGGFERRRRRSSTSARPMTARCSSDVELLVKSPGVPSEAPLVGAARRRGYSRVERDRARRPARRPARRRRHRHEREDDDDRASRRDVRAAAGRRSRSPATSAGRSARSTASCEAGVTVVCELSSFQLEDVESLRRHVAVLLNLTPDHLDRHGTFEALPRREAPHLRAAGPGRRRRRPARIRSASRPCAPRRVRRGRPASGRAADSGRAQPRERRRRDRSGAAPPASPTTRSPRPCARSRASRTGSSRSARSTACASSTIRRRRTRSRAIAALARLPARPPRHPRRQPQGHAVRRARRCARQRGSSRAYLIGETADEIWPRRCSSRGGALHRLRRSRDRGPRTRSPTPTPGEVVLLSPACASFDQFRDFEQRGERFREIVEAL